MNGAAIKSELQCQRVARALEELAREESLALRHGDYSALAEPQRRMESLIAFFAGVESVSAEVRALLERVRSLRAASAGLLEAEMARAVAERQALETSRRRLVRLRPVYAGPAALVPRISLSG